VTTGRQLDHSGFEIMAKESKIVKAERKMVPEDVDRARVEIGVLRNSAQTRALSSRPCSIPKSLPARLPEQPRHRRVRKASDLLRRLTGKLGDGGLYAKGCVCW
jgi:hypothetical protein